MRVAGVVMLLVLGLVSLAPRVRADDDVEKVIEGYCEDGSTIQTGPVHERSRLEELRKRLLKAHEAAPDDDVTTIRLAVLEARLGHDDRATVLLGEVAAVSSFRALALYDLGLIKMKLGRLAPARDLFAEAAAVGSDRAEAAFALALADERLGDWKGAARAVELAEKRSQGPLAATCALRAGVLHEKAGELDDALAAYRRAAAYEPAPTPGVVPALGAQTAGSRGRSDAARVLLRLGRAADAAQELETALAGRDDAELHFKHGLALFLAGKPADGEIARLEKSNPELAKKLAEIVARKRDVR